MHLLPVHMQLLCFFAESLTSGQPEVVLSVVDTVYQPCTSPSTCICRTAHCGYKGQMVVDVDVDVDIAVLCPANIPITAGQCWLPEAWPLHSQPACLTCALVLPNTQ